MGATDVRGRVVVVTGASSGIGRATALAFAREGAAVVAAARREGPLEALARECERVGAPALAVPLDVADAEAVEALAERTIGRFGRLDVWINNAAVSMFARLEEAPLDVYRRVIEANLIGCVHGARAAIPWFREQGRGVLINNSSGLGRVGAPYLSAYVMTKWALRGLGESLRQELRDAPGIHVCTILPPSIDTPIFRHAANYTGRAVQPLRPTYAPQKVARAVMRLARRPRRELNVGVAGKALAATERLAPGLAERLTGRAVERRHFADRAAPSSPGNVLEPLPGWTRADGGWREELWGTIARRLAPATPPAEAPRTRTRRVAAAGALAAAGAAAVALSRRDRDGVRPR